MQKVGRDVGVPGGVRRNEGVALQNGGGAQFFVARREAIHLLLQKRGTVDQTCAGIPCVGHVSSLALGGDPGSGIALLYVLYQPLRYWWEGELGMCGRKQTNVRPRLGEFWRFTLHGGDGEQEHGQVDGNQPNRDNRPSSRLYVVVTDRDQHELASCGFASFGFASLMRNVQTCNSSLELNCALKSSAPQCLARFTHATQLPLCERPLY